jgi:hypothetical protein
VFVAARTRAPDVDDREEKASERIHAEMRANPRQPERQGDVLRRRAKEKMVKCQQRGEETARQAVESATVAPRAGPGKITRTAMPSRPPTQQRPAIAAIALKFRRAGIGVLRGSLGIGSGTRSRFEPDTAAAAELNAPSPISSIPATSSAPTNFAANHPSLASIR